jgi:LAS superfamily LD-carboxypeptidase LdcB
VYVDNLKAENQQLLDTKLSLEIQLKDLSAEKILFSNQLSSLELSMQQQVQQYEYRLQQEQELTQQNQQQYEEQLQQKQEEITNLQWQVQVASTSTLQELSEHKIKVQETLKEMEEYKQKRMLARQEMIQLAKNMERMQQDGQELRNTVLYRVSPCVQEQVRNILLVL